MMTSSGSGSYRIGGSLSSSNLSPLAPPFKVEKSVPKPNLTNPSVNFSDGPVYGACFDPAPGQFWNSSSSSSSKAKCGATESGVTLADCSVSPNMYGYQGSQSNTSPSGVYYGNSKAVSAYDPFSYEPFPSRMATNADAAAKPYYPPYVSPQPQKDGYLGLGVGNVSGYDLLSHSGSSHLSGSGSAQVDRGHALSSDGVYKSKWGFTWGQLNDNEHGKWMDYTQGFVPKDFNSSNLSSNRSPLLVDGSSKSRPFVDINARPFVDGTDNNQLFGDVSNTSHLNPGACVTQDLDLHGQVSNVKDNVFDIFGGSYSLGSLGIDQHDHKSSFECLRARTSASASASISKDAPHLQEPILEPTTSFCGPQKANGSLPEDHFSQAGFYRFSCAPPTSTFPVSVTKLSYGGSSSSVESTPSAVKLNSMGIDAANHCNVTAGYNSCYQMEPLMPFGLKRQSSIRIRRPVPPSTAASSFPIGETTDSRLDDKVASEEMKISPELPHHLSSNIESSHAEAVYSVDKYSGGSDVHNPAEDSPCWKGASFNHFSPFGYSESVVPDVLVKKIDSCRSLNSQDLQNKSLFLNTCDSKDVSSGKVNEVTPLERPSAFDCTLNDNEDCGSVNPKSCCFDLNTADSRNFSDDSYASMAECNTLHKLKACQNSKSPPATELIFNGETSSARVISEAPLVDKIGKGTSVAAEILSGSPSIIGNDLADSLSGNKASLKSVSEVSDSRINANVLLRTMMNLSEIFRCYCFSNRAEVAGKQSVVIKQIINNLNASMLMMTGQTIPTSVLSTPDTFLQKDFAVQMVNDAEALAASVKLGRVTEDTLDYVSFEDERNSFGDANMKEAVKKLLSGNLQEEEVDQQNLLYKNLWLEAEASLCLMTAKARFLRMESEMMKKDGGAEGDKSTSSNVSTDSRGAVELATEDENSSSLGEYPKPNSTSQHNHIKHAPNSQVASLYISDSEKARTTGKETCFPSFFASNPHAFSSDSKLANENKDLHRVVEEETADRESPSPFLGECPNPAITNLHNNFEVSHIPNSQVPSFYSLGPGMSNSTNDVDTRVMARYQILQNRVGCSDPLNYKSNESPGEHNCPSSLYDSSNHSHASGTMNKLHDLDSGSVFGGYQMLKCRDNNLDYLKSEDQQLPGDENYLPDNASSSIPDKAFLYSQMSNSLGVFDEREAALMARFRIIQSCVDHSNSLINDSAPGQASVVVVEDENMKLGGSHQILNIKKTTFGPYPELTEDEGVDIVNVRVNEQAFAPIVKSSVILEGWYDNNDCSSSADWEHISSRDV